LNILIDWYYLYYVLNHVSEYGQSPHGVAGLVHSSSNELLREFHV